MSEGNASVEVAALKAEIEIDLDKFEEALDQATIMFENFTENIDRALEINLHINDDDINGVETQINSLKDSLSNIGEGNISENINSEGSEDTIEDLEEIKELEEEISNCGLDVDLSSDDIEEVIQQLEEVKAMQNEISDTDDTLKVNVEDIDNAIAQLQQLKEDEEETSKPLDVNIKANGARKVKEEVEGIGDAERETKKEGKGLTETLGTAIYALQVVYGALSGIAESSLDQFAQLQISGEIATRTFGIFGDNLNKFANTSVNALGMTSGETLHYADTLGLALKSQGASNQVAEEMSKKLIGVADNLTLASGGSMTMQQSVQILTAAIAGQTYGLKSLGINVTGVNKSWTPLHQAMYIMSKVSKDVSSNFGTLGQNMDTTSGEIKKAKAITGQFAESIGKILAPQLAGLNRHLSGLYKDWNGLSSGMKKGIIVAGEVVVGVLGIASALYVAIKAVEAMQTVFETFTAVMELDPIVLIITAIIGAVVLLYESWKHNWLGMRKIIDGVIKDLKPTFENFIKFIKQTFKSLKPAFKEFEKLWKTMKPLIEGILKVITDTVVIYVKETVEVIKVGVKVISDSIKLGADIIKEVFKVVGDVVRFFEDSFKRSCSGVRRIWIETGHIFEEVKTKIIDIFHDITNFFHLTIPNWIHFIISWFEDLPENLGYALGYALGTIVKWGENTYSYFVSNVPKWIDDIGHWFEELPSRIGEWLEQVINNVSTWGSNMFSEAEETGSNFIQGIETWFEQLPSRIGDFLWQVIGDVVRWGSNMINTGHEKMIEFAESIINAVENIPSEMEQIGLNIIEGLWHGIESEWDGLMSWVHNAAHSIVEGFKAALDIHSPSREMYREVGRWILPGISQALDDGMPQLLNNITDKVDTLVNHMSKKLKEGMQNIKTSSPELTIPWSTPNINNSRNNIEEDYINGGIVGTVPGQTNNFTIHESNNASETANQVIHKLRLAHFGL